MRLFIAINLSEEIKSALLDAIDKLRVYKGNFTRAENLHLTLVFIGETTDLEKVKKAMDNIYIDRFNLSIDGFGKFKRNGKDLYWAGVEKSEALKDLYNSLSLNLKNLGFNIENREYKPHITLGREVITDNEPNIEVSSTTMLVEKISLMKSERINGKLLYSEVYSKELQ